jgi:hypothetical protein
MIRSAAKLLFVSVFTLTLGVGVAGVASADDGKCKIATKGESATAKACAKGGIAEAKKVMKDMVKVAKANGGKFTCEGCHKDLETYELTKNATEDFKKLEAAQKK